jgi:hypothetical protein
MVCSPKFSAGGSAKQIAILEHIFDSAMFRYEKVCRCPQPAPNKKPLPADAGRFVGVLLDMLKYDLVGDITAGGAEVAPGPEMPAPVVNRTGFAGGWLV